MLTILQGDALSVPISIKLNGIEVTAADIQAVKVTMGGIEKRYPGEITYDSGRFLYYAPTQKLYKVRDGQGHTTQADWTPDVTPALWAVVSKGQSGTIDDPIDAARGMEYTYGLYYKDPEDGKTYLCERTGEAAGGTVVLQYLPHELVGHYFVEVNL